MTSHSAEQELGGAAETLFQHCDVSLTLSTSPSCLLLPVLLLDFISSLPPLSTVPPSLCTPSFFAALRPLKHSENKSPIPIPQSEDKGESDFGYQYKLNFSLYKYL